MEGSAAKVFLVVGPHGCGKTALARRMSGHQWTEGTEPTIGLDDEVGSVTVTPDAARLRADLHVLLPDCGVKVNFWEIGGKDCHLRSAPRGRPVDGLIVCYSLTDRSSFQTAAHLLMQHRTDRHLAHERSAVVSRVDSPSRLAVVLCGTSADEADEYGGHTVSNSEQVSFVERSGINGAFVTSARTGEGVTEAFQALLLASLEADEVAEASRMETSSKPPSSEIWSLTSPGTIDDLGITRDLVSMTSPRGLRRHEPSRGVPAAPVVEVLDHQGVPYGARLLSECLARGLLHRVVHVWLCDPRIGGLMLRRYSPRAAKCPRRWGPSAIGEVLCYQPEKVRQEGMLMGPQNAETSNDAAQRVLQEQLGIQQPGNIEHWLSCTSQDGNVREMQDVYAIDISQKCVSNVQLRGDESIEWVHFTDVFGPEGKKGGNQLFHIEEKYRTIVVQKMRVRVEHVRSDPGPALVALSWD